MPTTLFSEYHDSGRIAAAPGYRLARAKHEVRFAPSSGRRRLNRYVVGSRDI
jgi:hypothetical protein